MALSSLFHLMATAAGDGRLQLSGRLQPTLQTLISRLPDQTTQLMAICSQPCLCPQKVCKPLITSA